MALWSCRFCSRDPPSLEVLLTFSYLLMAEQGSSPTLSHTTPQPAQEKPFTSKGALKSVQVWSKVVSKSREMNKCPFSSVHGAKTRCDDWLSTSESLLNFTNRKKTWLQDKQRLEPSAACQVHAKGVAFILRGHAPFLKANQICFLYAHHHHLLPGENKPNTKVVKDGLLCFWSLKSGVAGARAPVSARTSDQHDQGPSGCVLSVWYLR